MSSTVEERAVADVQSATYCRTLALYLQYIHICVRSNLLTSCIRCLAACPYSDAERLASANSFRLVRFFAVFFPLRMGVVRSALMMYVDLGDEECSV